MSVPISFVSTSSLATLSGVPLTRSAAPVFSDERQLLPDSHPLASLISTLFEKGLIDQFGRFTQDVNNTSLPPLPPEECLYIKEFIFTPVKIVAKDNKFCFELVIGELFAYLKSKVPEIVDIEMIGGSVPSFLPPSYIRRCFKALGIEKADQLLDESALQEFYMPPGDYDIRITLKDTYQDLPRDLSQEVIHFMACKAYKTDQPEPLQKKEIKDNAFIKFKSYSDPHNYYFINSFGDRVNRNIDLLHVKLLRRQQLFTHDDLRISLYSSTGALAIDRSPLEVKSFGGYQALLDRLTKTLRVRDVATINELGFPLLISHMTKSRTCPEPGTIQDLRTRYLEQISATACPVLLRASDNLQQQRDHTALCKAERIASHLNHCLENHHQGDPAAAFALTVNCCFLFENLLTDGEIKQLWALMFPLFESITEESDSPTAAQEPALFLHSFMCRETFTFELISMLFRLRLLALENQPHFSKILQDGESAVQFLIPGKTCRNCLQIPLRMPWKALKNLTGKESLFSSFSIAALTEPTSKLRTAQKENSAEELSSCLLEEAARSDDPCMGDIVMQIYLKLMEAELSDEHKRALSRNIIGAATRANVPLALKVFRYMLVKLSPSSPLQHQCLNALFEKAPQQLSKSCHSHQVEYFAKSILHILKQPGSKNQGKQPNFVKGLLWTVQALLDQGKTGLGEQIFQKAKELSLLEEHSKAVEILRLHLCRALLAPPQPDPLAALKVWGQESAKDSLGIESAYDRQSVQIELIQQLMSLQQNELLNWAKHQLTLLCKEQIAPSLKSQLNSLVKAYCENLEQKKSYSELFDFIDHAEGALLSQQQLFSFYFKALEGQLSKDLPTESESGTLFKKTLKAAKTPGEVEQLSSLFKDYCHRYLSHFPNKKTPDRHINQIRLLISDAKCSRLFKKAPENKVELLLDCLKSAFEKGGANSSSLLIELMINLSQEVVSVPHDRLETTLKRRIGKGLSKGLETIWAPGKQAPAALLAHCANVIPLLLDALKSFEKIEALDLLKAAQHHQIPFKLTQEQSNTLINLGLSVLNESSEKCGEVHSIYRELTEHHDLQFPLEGNMPILFHEAIVDTQLKMMKPESAQFWIENLLQFVERGTAPKLSVAKFYQWAERFAAEGKHAFAANLLSRLEKTLPSLLQDACAQAPWMPVMANLIEEDPVLAVQILIENLTSIRKCDRDNAIGGYAAPLAKKLLGVQNKQAFSFLLELMELFPITDPETWNDVMEQIEVVDKEKKLRIWKLYNRQCKANKLLESFPEKNARCFLRAIKVLGNLNHPDMEEFLSSPEDLDRIFPREQDSRIRLKAVCIILQWAAHFAPSHERQEMLGKKTLAFRKFFFESNVEQKQQDLYIEAEVAAAEVLFQCEASPLREAGVEIFCSLLKKPSAFSFILSYLKDKPAASKKNSRSKSLQTLIKKCFFHCLKSKDEDLFRYVEQNLRDPLLSHALSEADISALWHGWILRKYQTRPTQMSQEETLKLVKELQDGILRLKNDPEKAFEAVKLNLMLITEFLVIYENPDLFIESSTAMVDLVAKNLKDPQSITTPGRMIEIMLQTLLASQPDKITVRQRILQYTAFTIRSLMERNQITCTEFIKLADDFVFASMWHDNELCGYHLDAIAQLTYQGPFKTMLKKTDESYLFKWHLIANLHTSTQKVAGIDYDTYPYDIDPKKRAEYTLEVISKAASQKTHYGLRQAMTILYNTQNTILNNFSDTLTECYRIIIAALKTPPYSLKAQYVHYSLLAKCILKLAQNPREEKRGLAAAYTSLYFQTICMQYYGNHLLFRDSNIDFVSYAWALLSEELLPKTIGDNLDMQLEALSYFRLCVYINMVIKENTLLAGNIPNMLDAFYEKAKTEQDKKKVCQSMLDWLSTISNIDSEQMQIEAKKYYKKIEPYLVKHAPAGGRNKLGDDR